MRRFIPILLILAFSLSLGVSIAASLKAPLPPAAGDPTATPTLTATATITATPTLTVTPTPTPTPDPGAPNLLYLPFVFSYSGPLQPPYDLVQFMEGDGRLYEVQHSNGSQARHQSHTEGSIFFHTKGNEISAEWEELWFTDEFIYRGTDTSPGSGLYYTLRDNGVYGSKWAPRYWNVGDVYERNPTVLFFRKSDCGLVVGGTQQSWLLFEAYYENYTFASGLELENVIQLAWLTNQNAPPEERYFYAEDYGLVGWTSLNNGMSYVSEIHEPGQRPDNTREEIPCLNDTAIWAQGLFEWPLPYWPGEHRR